MGPIEKPRRINFDVIFSRSDFNTFDKPKSRIREWGPAGAEAGVGTCFFVGKPEECWCCGGCCGCGGEVLCRVLLRREGRGGRRSAVTKAVKTSLNQTTNILLCQDTHLLHDQMRCTHTDRPTVSFLCRGEWKMSKEKGGSQDLPILQKISASEAQDIRNMFNLLCVNHSNRINQYLAIKLFRNLGLLSPWLHLTSPHLVWTHNLVIGLDVSRETLPQQLTLKDFLLFADAAAPDDIPEGKDHESHSLASQCEVILVKEVRRRWIV